MSEAPPNGHGLGRITRARAAAPPPQAANGIVRGNVGQPAEVGTRPTDGAAPWTVPPDTSVPVRRLRSFPAQPVSAATQEEVLDNVPAPPQVLERGRSVPHEELPRAVSQPHGEPFAIPTPAKVPAPPEVERGVSTVAGAGAPVPTIAPSAAAPSREYCADEHLLTLDQLAERFKPKATESSTYLDLQNLAHSGGLTATEAQRRLAENGRNRLTPPRQLPQIVLWLREFTNPFIVLLCIAAGLAYLAYGLTQDYRNITLAGALTVLIVILCTMTWNQQRRSSNVMAAIQKTIPFNTLVIRDGKQMKVPSEELVVGDIVRLTIGNKVPADIRVIVSLDAKVDISSLTGESVPIELSVEKRSEFPLEAHNIAFNASLLTNGEIIGIVIRTGDSTMIGSIAGLAGGTVHSKTTMEYEIHRVVIVVCVLAVVASVILFVIGLARGLGIIESFVNGFIFVLIAAVPEGLPLAVTSSLARAAARMSSQRVLVKQMNVIESLGSASVICSDKTGTLTVNRMTVMNMWLDGHFMDARRCLKPEGAEAMPTRVDDTQQKHHATMTIGRYLDRLADGTVVLRTLHTRGGGASSSMTTGAATGTHRHAPSLPPEWPGRGAPGAIIAVLSDGSPQPADQPDAATTPSSLNAPAADHDHDVQNMQQQGLNSLPQAVLVGHRSELHSSQVAGEGPPDQNASPKCGPWMSHCACQISGIGGTLRWQDLNSYTKLMIIMTMCNRARFSEPTAPELTQSSKARGANTDPERRKSDKVAIGDATEAAMLRYSDAANALPAIRKAFAVKAELPFNSVLKWSAAVVSIVHEPDVLLLFMKGAPERVFACCTRQLSGGEEKAIDDEFHDRFNTAYERFGVMGERVLGFAYKEITQHDLDAATSRQQGDGDDVAPRIDWKSLSHDLVFSGLVSLMDPPKPGVDEAIRLCRRGGIRVTMVTGDHPLTAEAIARNVGIVTGITAREVAARDGVDEDTIALDDPRVDAAVISGHHLHDFKQEEWDALLTKKEVVFARTSPQQKLLIVENYQRLGHVVAVTGDGTNDAPALKRAQVGVAMGGATASDVAREAGSLVLLDDDFTKVVDGIVTGRLLFDNLKKLCAYWLSHAPAQIVSVFFTLALSTPVPLPGLLILTVDLIVEQGPALSFATEPPESSLMDRPPRDLKRDKLVDGRVLLYSYALVGTLETLACAFAYFIIFRYHGVPASSVIYSGDYFRSNAPDLIIGGRLVTPSQQLSIAHEATAAFYVTLIMCQLVNLFLCKTRVASLFRNWTFFGNLFTFAGAALQVGSAAFFV